jgi:arylsulfatase A-like enzyme
MAAKAPNILLIMADQMAAPALPVYGHPLVKAPHLSRLADAGVRVRQRLLQQPALRAVALSLLTGLLPSRTGAFDNAASSAATSRRWRTTCGGRLPTMLSRQDAFRAAPTSCTASRSG